LAQARAYDSHPCMVGLRCLTVFALTMLPFAWPSDDTWSEPDLWSPTGRVGRFVPWSGDAALRGALPQDSVNKLDKLLVVAFEADAADEPIDKQVEADSSPGNGGDPVPLWIDPGLYTRMHAIYCSLLKFIDHSIALDRDMHSPVAAALALHIELPGTQRKHCYPSACFCGSSGGALQRAGLLSQQALAIQADNEETNDKYGKQATHHYH